MELFTRIPVIEMHLDQEEYELVLWGDPVCPQSLSRNLALSTEPETIISNVAGHYYFLLMRKSDGNIFLGNSLFSVLPVYYCSDRHTVLFSDSAITLGKLLGRREISRRFILETLLFNYPLFNHTLFDDIKLLPSNSYFRFSGDHHTIVRHTSIEDYFSASPRPWARSAGRIADIFIEAVQKYLPDVPYVHALTGGFDGRTLVSAGLHYGKSFGCYCFGAPDSLDLKIADLLARRAGLPLIPVLLDDGYIRNESRNCGEEFILNSSGSATFTRAHYLHAARRLSREYKHMVTGNFGSEVFRAAHVAGPVISANLRNLFGSADPDRGAGMLEESAEYRLLNMGRFRSEWEALREDLGRLPCYNPSFSGLTRNQRFYVFVFEEIFRKYFGAEMVNQFRYIKNRTPFLDTGFLKAILETRLAGIHSGYFEHNPFKRYKGQVLYAHIIRKTYPDFETVPTDKGYRPDDLISFRGKLRISAGYLRKISGLGGYPPDPFSVGAAWRENRKQWEAVPVSTEYFRQEFIKTLSAEALYRVFSLSYLTGVV